MDFRRVFSTYLEAPKSILAKNPNNGRILLNLSIFPLCPCLGSLGLLSFEGVCENSHHPDPAACGSAVSSSGSGPSPPQQFQHNSGWSASPPEYVPPHKKTHPGKKSPNDVFLLLLWKHKRCAASVRSFWWRYRAEISAMSVSYTHLRAHET